MSSEPIANIENFLSNYEKLKTIYNKAQETLLTSQQIDNEKYLECIKLCNILIKYLDELNPFVIQPHQTPRNLRSICRKWHQ